ncbi:MAG TPA: phasin family protein [Dehalococcoidia bacterium]|nr:phasin family protein [Dehalococcoidia bacterium]
MNERRDDTSSRAFDALWNAWYTALGGALWAQDQAEKMVRLMLDQGRVTREESKRVMDDLVEQVRRNQSEMQRLAQEAVRSSLANLNIPTQDQIKDLNRKIDELNRKIDAMPK